MMDKPFYPVPRRAPQFSRTNRAGKLGQPDPPSGRPTNGRITKIVRGQGHGFIRAADGHDVFFHRGEIQNAKFNDLVVGDVVVFEVIEDQVSGRRAGRVRLKRG